MSMSIEGGACFSSIQIDMVVQELRRCLRTNTDLESLRLRAEHMPHDLAVGRYMPEREKNGWLDRTDCWLTI